jgi:hypothetical protein
MCRTNIIIFKGAGAKPHLAHLCAGLGGFFQAWLTRFDIKIIAVSTFPDKFLAASLQKKR